MDQFDIKLLDALQQDGRLTNYDLAERVGLSASQCSRRRAALEETGIIASYHARLSTAGVGLGVVVFVQVTHDNGLDLGTEGTIKLDTTPSSTGLTKFGIADALTDPTQYGAFYKVLNQDINVTLHALASVNKTEILSRPSILTRSNQPAYIQVGQQIPR